MAKFIAQKTGEEEIYIFQCPGCEYSHGVRVKGPEPRWNWNGDADKPTVTPSVLARGTVLCHSFITDGKIRFLDDCEHALKGQTVEIPDWES